MWRERFRRSRSPGDSDAIFRFGEDSNVRHPDYNDPRFPPLRTEDLPHFTAYLRMETAGEDPAWSLEWVSVRVNPDGFDTWRYTNPSLRRDARRHIIWLDTPLRAGAPGLADRDPVADRQPCPAAMPPLDTCGRWTRAGTSSS